MLLDASAARRRRERCPGQAVRLRRLLADPQDHQLAMADVDGGPCVLCVACGGWCRLRPREPWIAAKARRSAKPLAPSRLNGSSWASCRAMAVTAPHCGAGCTEGDRCAQAVAHRDSWREPARLAASMEPEPPARTSIGNVAVTVTPLQRYRLLPSWRCSTAADSMETHGDHAGQELADWLHASCGR